MAPVGNKDVGGSYTLKYNRTSSMTNMLWEFCDNSRITLFSLSKNQLTVLYHLFTLCI